MAKPDAPLVSIVIPNRNYARFLRAAMDSALRQDYARCEVVVVDDGSTDDSREILNEYHGRIVVVMQEHSGLSRARNAGAAAAGGEFIVFLDSDDQLVSTAVGRLLSHLQKEQCGVVIGDCMITDVDDRDLGKVYTNEPVVRAKALANGNPFYLSGVLLAHSAFTSIGGFNPAYVQCEDYDFLLKACAITTVGHLPEITARIRRHENSMSHDLVRQSEWELIVAMAHRPAFPRQMREAIENLHVRLAVFHRRAGNRPGFWRHAWQAARVAPHHWRNWARLAWRLVF